MTNFELILRKIQNWELGSARQDMSSALALDLDDAQIQQLDAAFREYQYVADNIEALRRELSSNPAKVLLAVGDLPEIKNTHPAYEKLRADTVEQVKIKQRADVLKRVAEAEDLSQTVKSWSEAQAILEDVKLTYPNWAADQELKRNILQAENETGKAQQSDALLQEFSKHISLGKPDRCNEIVNELELLGKVMPEELENLRRDANRLAAHKQNRSSKDTQDFSEVEGDIENEIMKVERSVHSIQSQANYSYRTLFNNRSRQADLYREKTIKLGSQVTGNTRARDGLFDELGKGASEIRKAEIERQIKQIDSDLEKVQEALTRFENQRKQVEEDLQGIEVEARTQIAKFVDNQLEMGNGALGNGELESATTFLETAKNAGLPEEYKDSPLTDQLGVVPLTPDQQNRVKQLEVHIAERREQRQSALKIKAAAQRQLAGQSLSLSQLKNILSELQEAQTLDKDVPGLAYALERLGNRIEQEIQLQKEQYGLRIEMLCQKGLLGEAQRLYHQAVETLGRDASWQTIIDDTQKKIDRLEKIKEKFQADFRLAREALNPPSPGLKALLEEWKRDGFETTLIANAEARYEQYANNIAKVREQIDLLEKGLQSGESPTKLQAAAEFLQGCFLRGEIKIQALLVRYWLAQANQQKGRDATLEEDYLQHALGYADAAKDDIQLARIKTRLNELQNQTEQGRKKQKWIEAINRYEKEDFDRAVEMAKSLPADDPLRQDAYVARLIDDIEYKGKRMRAELHCKNAREQFQHGNYDLANDHVQQALRESSNYFEAISLDGEIRAAHASEEPLLRRIQDAFDFNAETDLNLTNSQVKELEDVHSLVDQFKQKESGRTLEIQLKKFTAYYQDWHELVQQKVASGVDNARLLMRSGEFESARNTLNTLLELGIPSDVRSLISTAENELQNYQSQADIVNGMVDRAVELAGEGKDGIEKAILLVTIPKCPEFIRPKLDKKLEFFKNAQNEFGKILDDVKNNKSVEICKLLEAAKKPSLKIIEFTDQIDLSNRYASDLQTYAGTLRDLGIKQANQTFRAVIYLQRIVSWYANSVDIVEESVRGDNYSKLANQIEEQIRVGSGIKNEIPSDIPHSQTVLLSIDAHISLLGKLKHNNEVFDDIYKKINFTGKVGWPDKTYWNGLRSQVNAISDLPHVTNDEKKITHLLELINQKEDTIRKTFVALAVSSGSVILCVLSMVLVSMWSQWIGPTYFPTPTITPTVTLAPTFTPTATITPLPTLTPTLTPVPLMIRVKSRSESVYNSPMDNVVVDSVKKNDVLKLVGYCQYGSGNYWVKVEHNYNAGINYLGGDYAWIHIDKTYLSGNVVASDNPDTSITYMLANYYSYLEISCSE